jgi:PhoPQ-activated pathogenicity-related protein
VRRFLFLCVAATTLLFAPRVQAKADSELQQYIRQGGAIWELRGTKEVGDVTIYDLHLVSQKWHGFIWEHSLRLFYPKNSTAPHFCTIMNTGGKGGGNEETQMGVLVAKSSGSPFAMLAGNPRQPIFGGKVEDEIIVYTWQKYMETGDPTWPLHFPMAKAVIKGMDAVQELSKERSLPEINEFLVTGASKRGWTTWLVGASQDKRVKGIAPMVIDTLNVAAQIPHQLASFGQASEQIADYTNGGMLEALKTERGQKLLALEDPYSYRNVLTMPKLIINGTNDRYWAQDALNLYWDGLKGKKWILYVPNSGHGLEDRVRVFNTLSTFGQTLAQGKSFPQPKWEYTDSATGTTLQVSSDIEPVEVRLFSTTAATKDFRNSKWAYTPMNKSEKGYAGTYARPQSGFAATYGEIVYSIGGKQFTLTTQIRILGSK